MSLSPLITDLILVAQTLAFAYHPLRLCVCDFQGRDGLPGRDGPRGPEGRQGLPGGSEAPSVGVRGEKGERVSTYT